MIILGRKSINSNIISDMEDIVNKLKIFIEDEARSCSMDFGCITPLYVYRMWGGSLSLEEIEAAFKEVDIQNERK